MEPGKEFFCNVCKKRRVADDFEVNKQGKQKKTCSRHTKKRSLAFAEWATFLSEIHAWNQPVLLLPSAHLSSYTILLFTIMAIARLIPTCADIIYGRRISENPWIPHIVLTWTSFRSISAPSLSCSAIRPRSRGRR
jgi:hypothetical protein